MPLYSVIRKSDQAEIYRYGSAEPIEWFGMEYATHDHFEVVEPEAPAPVVTLYGGRRELSPLEFLRLLTAEERITIRQAAKVSPAVDDYLDLLDKAQTVNLDNVDVVGGLSMLEGGGLLAAGRAQEILNG